MELTTQTLMAYILVFCRMGGMVFMNPLLMRSEIPARVRMFVAGALTLLITPSVQQGAPAELENLALVLALSKELLAGMACGFIFSIYYYLLAFIGHIMDVQFGLSMATVFDPGSNIQVSITGRLLQTVFALYFFVTNSHLIMIRIFTSSYDVVPLGQMFYSQALPSFVLEQFVSVFSLAIRLGLPFIAAEFVLEISMGILMKLIPSINVFVLNIQLKVLLGIALMFLFALPMTNFLDQYMETMLQSMQNVLFPMQQPATG